jgi:hypothetical protein
VLYHHVVNPILYHLIFFLLLTNLITISLTSHHFFSLLLTSHFSFLFFFTSTILFPSGKLGTIGQITVCQCRNHPTRILIFANTHLFFHPAAAFARLLQTDVIISTCMHVRQCIQTQGLGCLNDLKIDGEEVIEVGDEDKTSNDYENKGENENRNEKEDKNDKKEKEMCDSIIKELEKLEVGSGVRMSPLPPPLMTGSAPLSVSIMLLGDLNSTPETAVIEYFRTYVHAHMHTYIHAHTRTRIQLHTITLTYTHAHTHTRMHTYLYADLHTHLKIHLLRPYLHHCSSTLFVSLSW